MRSVLETLAADTWDRLYDSYQYDCPQGEETITDVNLLDIARNTDDTVLAYKTNRNEESVSGVDWEWWIGTRGRWRRYAVQAKRLSISAGYPRVDHVNQHGAQIHLLARYARLNHCVPLYCLYNYPSTTPVQAAHWHCCDKYDEVQFGCTVTPLNVMATARPRRFDVIHRNDATLPWRCLMCHTGESRLAQAATFIDYPGSELHQTLSGSSAVIDNQSLPAFLNTALQENRSRRFSIDDLPESHYSREAGAPRRIAVTLVSEPDGISASGATARPNLR
jgi:hypothetical protein